MNLKEQLAAAQKRAAELATHMKSRDLTEAEVTEVTELADKIDGLKSRIKANDDAAALLGGVAVVTDSEEGAEAQTPAGVKSMGQAFTQSDRFKSTFAKGHNQDPIKVDTGTSAKRATRSGGRKAATGTVGSGSAFLLPQDLGFDDVTVAPALTLLDLITMGQTTSNGIQYVQARMVTRGAAVVKESTDSVSAGFVKPKSTIEAVKVTAPVVTYADGIDITRQMMADAPYLETMIDTELTYNLKAAIQDGLINGDGEDGDTPTGILHTTGVQEQGPTDEEGTDLTGAATGDIFATVRAAITKVVRLNGGTVNAVLLSPEDDERWDLARDNENRFIGAGPYGLGYNTAWGRPRVACEALPQGTFILGDFKTIAWLEREAVSITANPQHKDYAARNLVYLLAESRGVQTIRRPAFLVVGKFNRTV